MTSDENPADTVIKQAAVVLNQSLFGSWQESVGTRQARALHDAGLLADSTDRDERRNEAYRAQLARADRAEAEVAKLRATVERDELEAWRAEISTAEWKMRWRQASESATNLDDLLSKVRAMCRHTQSTGQPSSASRFVDDLLQVIGDE